MIYGHCIQFGSGTSYMGKGDVFDNSVFQIIYSFHMPLLMLVSGYFFTHTVDRYPIEEIVFKKVVTLLLPIISWTTIMSLLFSGIIQRETSILNILFRMLRSYMTEMWFLWAVFWNSMIVLIVHKVGKDKMILHVLLVIAALFIVNGNYTQSYLYMYPYFVTGYLGGRSKKLINGKAGALSAVIYMILIQLYNRNCFIYTTGTYLCRDNFPGQLLIDLYRWAIGFAGTFMVLFTVRYVYARVGKADSKIWKCIAEIGKCSMGIYIISSYMNVLVLIKIQYCSQIYYLINLLEMVIVTIVSYLLVKILEKNKWTRSLLLGGRAS